MSAVAIVVVAMVVIFLITAVLLLRHIGASPKQQYGRELRGIQRIRKGNRAGDPSATSIGVNWDAFHGS